MRFITVTADIYSTIKGESYRLYVGSDLMTERTFSWEPDTEYVEEHIIIQSESPAEYEVSVQSVSNNACFSIKNVTVDRVNTERKFSV